MKNIILTLLSVFTFCIHANEEHNKMSDYVGYLAATHNEIAKYLVVTLKKETTPELGEKVNNKIHELDKKQKELGVSQGFTNIIENIDQIFMNLGTEKVLSSKYPEIFNIVWQVKRVNFFSRMSQALAKKID